MPKTEYALTAAGRKALEKYLNHMEALIHAMRTRTGRKEHRAEWNVFTSPSSWTATDAGR